MKTAPSLLIFTAMLALNGHLSAEVQVGNPAPDFTLKDTHGKERSLSEFKGNPIVLEWFNHSCPFVKKHYSSGNMQALQKKYTDKGVIWLSINSTHPGHENYCDDEKSNTLTMEKKASPTAVLKDGEGKVGHLYGAKTTPHMYVINEKGVLIYQGAIDDKKSTNPNDVKTSKNYVASALDALLEGKEVPPSTTSPYGCSVKYAK